MLAPQETCDVQEQGVATYKILKRAGKKYPLCADLGNSARLHINIVRDGSGVTYVSFGEPSSDDREDTPHI